MKLQIGILLLQVLFQIYIIQSRELRNCNTTNSICNKNLQFPHRTNVTDASAVLNHLLKCPLELPCKINQTKDLKKCDNTNGNCNGKQQFLKTIVYKKIRPVIDQRQKCAPGLPCNANETKKVNNCNAVDGNCNGLYPIHKGENEVHLNKCNSCNVRNVIKFCTEKIFRTRMCLTGLQEKDRNKYIFISRSINCKRYDKCISQYLRKGYRQKQYRCPFRYDLKTPGNCCSQQVCNSTSQRSNIEALTSNFEIFNISTETSQTVEVSIAVSSTQLRDSTISRTPSSDGSTISTPFSETLGVKTSSASEYGALKEILSTSTTTSQADDVNSSNGIVSTTPLSFSIFDEVTATAVETTSSNKYSSSIITNEKSSATSMIENAGLNPTASIDSTTSSVKMSAQTVESTTTKPSFANEVIIPDESVSAIIDKLILTNQENTTQATSSVESVTPSQRDFSLGSKSESFMISGVTETSTTSTLASSTWIGRSTTDRNLSSDSSTTSAPSSSIVDVKTSSVPEFTALNKRISWSTTISQEGEINSTNEVPSTASSVTNNRTVTQISGFTKKSSSPIRLTSGYTSLSTLTEVITEEIIATAETSSSTRYSTPIIINETSPLIENTTLNPTAPTIVTASSTKFSAPIDETRNATQSLTPNDFVDMNRNFSISVGNLVKGSNTIESVTPSKVHSALVTNSESPSVNTKANTPKTVKFSTAVSSAHTGYSTTSKSSDTSTTSTSFGETLSALDESTLSSITTSDFVEVNSTNGIPSITPSTTGEGIVTEISGFTNKSSNTIGLISEPMFSSTPRDKVTTVNSTVGVETSRVHKNSFPTTNKEESSTSMISTMENINVNFTVPITIGGSISTDPSVSNDLQSASPTKLTSESTLTPRVTVEVEPLASTNVVETSTINEYSVSTIINETSSTSTPLNFTVPIIFTSSSPTISTTTQESIPTENKIVSSPPANLISTEYKSTTEGPNETSLLITSSSQVADSATTETLRSSKRSTISTQFSTTLVAETSKISESTVVTEIISSSITPSKNNEVNSTDKISSITPSTTGEESVTKISDFTKKSSSTIGLISEPIFSSTPLDKVSIVESTVAVETSSVHKNNFPNNNKEASSTSTIYKMENITPNFTVPNNLSSTSTEASVSIGGSISTEPSVSNDLQSSSGTRSTSETTLTPTITEVEPLDSTDVVETSTNNEYSVPTINNETFSTSTQLNFTAPIIFTSSSATISSATQENIFTENKFVSLPSANLISTEYKSTTERPNGTSLVVTSSTQIADSATTKTLKSLKSSANSAPLSTALVAETPKISEYTVVTETISFSITASEMNEANSTDEIPSITPSTTGEEIVIEISVSTKKSSSKTGLISEPMFSSTQRDKVTTVNSTVAVETSSVHKNSFPTTNKEASSTSMISQTENITLNFTVPFNLRSTSTKASVSIGGSISTEPSVSNGLQSPSGTRSTSKSTLTPTITDEVEPLLSTDVVETLTNNEYSVSTINNETSSTSTPLNFTAPIIFTPSSPTISSTTQESISTENKIVSSPTIYLISTEYNSTAERPNETSSLITRSTQIADSTTTEMLRNSKSSTNSAPFGTTLVAETPKISESAVVTETISSSITASEMNEVNSTDAIPSITQSTIGEEIFTEISDFTKKSSSTIGLISETMFSSTPRDKVTTVNSTVAVETSIGHKNSFPTTNKEESSTSMISKTENITLNFTVPFNLGSTSTKASVSIGGSTSTEPSDSNGFQSPSGTRSTSKSTLTPTITDEVEPLASTDVVETSTINEYSVSTIINETSSTSTLLNFTAPIIFTTSSPTISSMTQESISTENNVSSPTVNLISTEYNSTTERPNETSLLITSSTQIADSTTTETLRSSKSSTNSAPFSTTLVAETPKMSESTVVTETIASSTTASEMNEVNSTDAIPWITQSTIGEEIFTEESDFTKKSSNTIGYETMFSSTPRDKVTTVNSTVAIETSSVNKNSFSTTNKEASSTSMISEMENITLNFTVPIILSSTSTEVSVAIGGSISTEPTVSNDPQSSSGTRSKSESTLTATITDEVEPLLSTDVVETLTNNEYSVSTINNETSSTSTPLNFTAPITFTSSSPTISSTTQESISTENKIVSSPTINLISTEYNSIMEQPNETSLVITSSTQITDRTTTETLRRSKSSTNSAPFSTTLVAETPKISESTVVTESISSSITASEMNEVNSTDEIPSITPSTTGEKSVTKISGFTKKSSSTIGLISEPIFSSIPLDKVTTVESTVTAETSSVHKNNFPTNNKESSSTSTISKIENITLNFTVPFNLNSTSTNATVSIGGSISTEPSVSNDLQSSSQTGSTGESTLIPTVIDELEPLASSDVVETSTNNEYSVSTISNETSSTSIPLNFTAPIIFTSSSPTISSTTQENIFTENKFVSLPPANLIPTEYNSTTERPNETSLVVTSSTEIGNSATTKTLKSLKSSANSAPLSTTLVAERPKMSESTVVTETISSSIIASEMNEVNSTDTIPSITQSTIGEEIFTEVSDSTKKSSSKTGLISEPMFSSTPRDKVTTVYSTAAVETSTVHKNRFPATNKEASYTSMIFKMENITLNFTMPINLSSTSTEASVSIGGSISTEPSVSNGLQSSSGTRSTSESTLTPTITDEVELLASTDVVEASTINEYGVSTINNETSSTSTSLNFTAPIIFTSSLPTISSTTQESISTENKIVSSPTINLILTEYNATTEQPNETSLLVTSSTQIADSTTTETLRSSKSSTNSAPFSTTLVAETPKISESAVVIETILSAITPSKMNEVNRTDEIPSITPSTTGEEIVTEISVSTKKSSTKTGLISEPMFSSTPRDKVTTVNSTVAVETSSVHKNSFPTTNKEASFTSMVSNMENITQHFTVPTNLSSTSTEASVAIGGSTSTEPSVSKDLQSSSGTRSTSEATFTPTITDEVEPLISTDVVETSTNNEFSVSTINNETSLTSTPLNFTAPIIFTSSSPTISSTMQESIPTENKIVSSPPTNLISTEYNSTTERLNETSLLITSSMQIADSATAETLRISKRSTISTQFSITLEAETPKIFESTVVTETISSSITPSKMNEVNSTDAIPSIAPSTTGEEIVTEIEDFTKNSSSTIGLTSETKFSSTPLDESTVAVETSSVHENSFPTIIKEASSTSTIYIVENTTQNFTVPINLSSISKKTSVPIDESIVTEPTVSNDLTPLQVGLTLTANSEPSSVSSARETSNTLKFSTVVSSTEIEESTTTSNTLSLDTSTVLTSLGETLMTERSNISELTISNDSISPSIITIDLEEVNSTSETHLTTLSSTRQRTATETSSMNNSNDGLPDMLRTTESFPTIFLKESSSGSTLFSMITDEVEPLVSTIVAETSTIKEYRVPIINNGTATISSTTQENIPTDLISTEYISTTEQPNETSLLVTSSTQIADSATIEILRSTNKSTTSAPFSTTLVAETPKISESDVVTETNSSSIAASALTSTIGLTREPIFSLAPLDKVTTAESTVVETSSVHESNISTTNNETYFISTRSTVENIALNSSTSIIFTSAITDKSIVTEAPIVNDVTDEQDTTGISITVESVTPTKTDLSLSSQSEVNSTASEMSKTALLTETSSVSEFSISSDVISSLVTASTSPEESSAEETIFSPKLTEEVKTVESITITNKSTSSSDLITRTSTFISETSNTNTDVTTKMSNTPPNNQDKIASLQRATKTTIDGSTNVVSNTFHENGSVVSEPTQVSPPVFQCPGVGQYPDLSDCRKFHLCKNIISVVIDVKKMCPKGSLYDPQKKQCTTRQVQCACKHILSCDKAGTFEHPNDCNKYYTCVWSSKQDRYTAKEYRCPSRHKFNIKRKLCVPSKTCGSPKTTNSIVPSNSVGDIISNIFGLVSSQGAISQNKQKNFFAILNNVAINIISNSSVLAAPCTRDCRDKNSASLAFKCPDIGKHPDSSDCGKFYLCKNSPSGMIDVKRSCRNGTFYDAYKRKCTTTRIQCPWRDQLICNEEGTFAHPTKCNEYYKCVRSGSNGYQPKQYRCPSSYKFSDKAKLCLLSKTCQSLPKIFTSTNPTNEVLGSSEISSEYVPI
ncbi:serine-rich adhesin for platelets-like isoform X3 [Tenebrio molitor]|uniref:serine-rich adhesin for platelets-like isoform X3 n=1 Tax=Tenebrio molitor TaxID=7067 RepID=UPI00362488D8